MPPKKGKSKSKSKKKEHLTEDQKKKLAEQKALAEQEKIGRRREVTNAFLKLKKEKEQALIKLNMNKLLDVWRPKLRKLKIQELMDDYKLMRNAFERAFDKKNDLMLQLRDAVDRNQADYDNAVDSHMHNIDKMMEFWQQRLQQVRESYNEERSKLIQILSDERLRLENYQETSIKDLERRMNGIKSHFEEQAAESQADFTMKQEEIRNKGIEEVHILKSKVDEKMNLMWSDLQSRLINYDTGIAGKRAEYIKYKERDEIASREINDQFERLQSMREGLAKVNTKIELFDKALGQYFSELSRKKQDLRSKYDDFMKQHSTLMKSSVASITMLASKITEVQDKLDSKLEHREKVMRVIERCRQQERMDEKLDPFMLNWGVGISTSGGAQVFELGSNSSAAATNEEFAGEDDFDIGVPLRVRYPAEDPGEEAVYLGAFDEEPQQLGAQGATTGLIISPLEQMVQDLSILENFWIRFNRVSLERATLAARREALLHDNCHLKVALRNYMGGLNPIMHDVNTFHDQYMVMDQVPQQSSLISPSASSIVLSANRGASGRLTSAGQGVRKSGKFENKSAREVFDTASVIDGADVVRTMRKCRAKAAAPHQLRKEVEGAGGARVPRLIIY